MNYVICPRCKFRVAANRHYCDTCGYAITFKKPAASEETPSPTSSKNKPGGGNKQQQGSSFWKQFLGLDNSSDSSMDNRSEEALSET